MSNYLHYGKWRWRKKYLNTNIKLNLKWFAGFSTIEEEFCAYLYLQNSLQQHFLHNISILKGFLIVQKYSHAKIKHKALGIDYERF